MKFKFKHIWVILFAFTVLLFASCDKKKPDKGYLSNDEVLKIVEGFSPTTDFASYSVKGNFQYKAMEEDIITPTIDLVNEPFFDSMGSSSGIGVNTTDKITSKSLYFKLYIEDKKLYNAGLITAKFDPKTPYVYGTYEESVNKYSYMSITKNENGEYEVVLTEDFDSATKVFVTTESKKYYINFLVDEKKVYVDIQVKDGIPQFVLTETPDGPFTSYNMKNAVFTKKIDGVTYYFEISNPTESYYLRLPMHITYNSWTVKNGHKTRIEEILLTIGQTLDEVYYYTDAQGNLIIRTFGANKALIIKNPTKVTCHAKWNVTIVYDKNGYLVSEKFETINAHKEPDSKTCYGEAKYTFA